MKKGIRICAAAILLSIASVASATVPDARQLGESTVRKGDYEIHYSAFNSTFIPPAIAESYQLERGPRTGILNIAIRNVKSNELGQAVKGTIKGNTANLLGQRKSLTFSEVNEGDAIYYLASFRFSNEEQLKFDLAVTPDKQLRSERVEFSQQFYEGTQQ